MTPASQPGEPSNDNTAGTILRLDLGLMLAVFGIVAAMFGQITYTVATGTGDVVSALRR